MIQGSYPGLFKCPKCGKLHRPKLGKMICDSCRGKPTKPDPKHLGPMTK